MILAGIDIGTNSLRLLVAEIRPNSFRQIYSERKVTRLGQGLDRTGKLSRDAEERSLQALLEFTGQIRRHAAVHTATLGTSALRNASNSSAFIHEVKKRTGLDINVITGEEEARLTLLGVAQALRGARRQREDKSLKSALVIDIGGGSTEIIMTRPTSSPVMVSLPLGAVYLTERFIKQDPSSLEELQLLRRSIREELDKYIGTIQPNHTGIFVGTAGTITTLAAMSMGLVEYDPDRINRSVLTREFIDDIVHKLGSITIEERKMIRGLEQGREDIILAGAVITQELMKRFGYLSMLVTDWGLREGIVLDLYEKLRKKSLG